MNSRAKGQIVHNRKQARPTHVALTERALKEGDDFLTVWNLRDRTKLEGQKILVSLHHLFEHRAAAMLVDQGVTYWYGTPETDNRVKVILERKPEEPGSRRKAKPMPGLARKVPSDTGEPA